MNLDVFGLRQHGHGCSTGVYSPLRLGCRNALHAVHAALETHGAVYTVASAHRDPFFPTTHAVLGLRQDLELPAPLLSVTAVHPEQITCKEPRLVAALARTDL